MDLGLSQPCLGVSKESHLLTELLKPGFVAHLCIEQNFDLLIEAVPRATPLGREKNHHSL